MHNRQIYNHYTYEEYESLYESYITKFDNFNDFVKYFKLDEKTAINILKIGETIYKENNS